jgi:DNA-binding CsgD family transcriptional regulator
MSQMRPVLSPLVVGRDSVLAAIDHGIGEAKAGRGSMVLLAGEAGIGKTRLLRASYRGARLAGLRVSEGAVAPQDSLVPLASILDLARSASPEDFGRLGPDILAIEGGKGGDTLASRRILVREVADRILAGVDAPTLLAFEDLQWADELSLEVIGELARHAPDRPLFLIGAYRLDELPIGSIHREWRSRLLTQRSAEEIHLERLDRDETALVTTLILGTGLPASREVVDAIHERTNGIPLHIEELLAAVGDRLETGADAIRAASVPDTIEDAVLARAQRLSDDARAVARAGAVMGRCFAPDVLAGIMDRPVAELDAPLQELVDNAILHPFAWVDQGYFDFRHQLLRDALYGSVPPSELRRLHARAAEFGAELMGSSEIHASIHYERAGLRTQAFRAALNGARAAAAVSSRYESFELYRRALANVPDGLAPNELADLHAELFNAASAVDDVPLMEEAARTARRLYLEAGDALGAASALTWLATVARRDVRPRSERQALLTEAEKELDAIPASPERAAAMADVRFQQAVLELDAVRLPETRERLEELRALVTESARSEGEEVLDARDVDFLAAWADVLDGDVRAGLDTMLDIARDARSRDLESTGVTAYRIAAALGTRVIEYPIAQVGLSEGLRYADEIEQSYCRRILAATSAQTAWAAGDWDDAVRIAALELVGRGSRRGTLGSRDVLGFVATGRGEVERARDLHEAALAIARPAAEVELILPALWGLAEAALVGGDAARAFDHCNEAVEIATPTGERALLVPFIVTGVRAAIADRRPDVAERWLARVTDLMADWPGLARPALAHAEGLVRMSGGSTVAARALLEEAAAGWDARSRIWESTWARLDLAACLLRSNRYVEGTRLVAEVDAIARRLGARPLIARAEELQRSARGRGADEEAWHPLTTREFEVARHIAEGLTNSEIATEIAVSPKTVSAHVEHILAKLGVSRRAEVAAWVTTVGRPDAPAAVRIEARSVAAS